MYSSRSSIGTAGFLRHGGWRTDGAKPLHRRILGSGDFVDGAYDIHWLERFVGLKR